MPLPDEGELPFPDEGALPWPDEGALVWPEEGALLSSVEVPLPEPLKDAELAELDPPPQTAGPGMV